MTIISFGHTHITNRDRCRIIVYHCEGIRCTGNRYIRVIGVLDSTCIKSKEDNLQIFIQLNDVVIIDINREGLRGVISGVKGNAADSTSEVIIATRLFRVLSPKVNGYRNGNWICQGHIKGNNTVAFVDRGCTTGQHYA